MNNAFYKILRLEFKLNYINWIIIVGIFFLIMVWQMAYKDSSIIGGSIIPIMILFSSLITLHSYSESINRQSMEMYHLLPVDRNSKFFSKQLITLVFFPFILLGLYLIFAIFIYPLVFNEFQHSFLSPNFEPGKIFSFFIWAHSFATFFAILFKKRKILYAIACLLGLQIIISLIMMIWMTTKIKTGGTVVPFENFPNNFNGAVQTGLVIFVPVILYFISYRLFFRRQL